MEEGKHEEHRHHSKEEGHAKKRKTSEDFVQKMRQNPWILSTLVLGILVLVFLVSNFTGIIGKTISEKEAGEKMLNFVKAQTGGQGEILEVKSFDDNFYEITISLQGQEIPIYSTKDGKYFVPSFTPLDIETEESKQTEEEKEITKSDKPKAELFVMTHCPYGTQAEKGFIPMMNAMGSSVDAKIRFVHYFMHGETEENETYVQVCLREEQSSKYLSYLTCFLEDGNTSRCLKETKVDTTKMNTCIKNGKAKEYYQEDSDLSKKYGVQGSPTLVVNGGIVSSGRSANAYLDTICKAFNSAQDKCSTLKLSSQNPSPMWGWGETNASATTAQC